MERFAEEDLLVATFFPQRLQKVISTIEDIDGHAVSYDVHVLHLQCISPKALFRFIIPTPTGFQFEQSVYFHPNVSMDGWIEIGNIHERAREKYNKELAKEIEMQKGKDNLKGKEKGKGKGKGKEKERVKFPDFPLQPRFWEESVRGSKIGLWPPRFFDEWIELRKSGKILCLDPLPDDIAGLGPPPTTARPASTSHTPSFRPSSSPHLDELLGPPPGTHSPPSEGFNLKNGTSSTEDLFNNFDEIPASAFVNFGY